ncbi:6164_t:CDS:2, partial [Gigaspora rosea]
SAAENCTYNTICKCPTGLTQGTYCGGDIGCDNTQVYECSPTGDTCQYGYNVNCDQCGALKCPKSVVSASSSPISLKPTTSQIQNPPKPTSTPPQKYLFIGIGSGIGGIILASSLIFFGIFFYKKNKLRPIPTPGNADHRKKMKPIPTPGSMRDEI